MHATLSLHLTFPLFPQFRLVWCVLFFLPVCVLVLASAHILMLLRRRPPIQHHRLRPINVRRGVIQVGVGGGDGAE